jgi:hypothetical protein
MDGSNDGDALDSIGTGGSFSGTLSFVGPALVKDEEGNTVGYIDGTDDGLLTG